VDDTSAEQGQGWFVYAVVDAGSDLPSGLAGLDDVTIELVSAGRVAAVVSRFDPERSAGRAADLWSYHGVVDALAEALDAVVPVRFGSVLLGDVAEEFLVPQEGYLAECLDQVRGCVQLTVQADYDQDAVLREIVATEPEVAALRERTRGLPEDAAVGDRVRLGELVAAAVEARRSADAAVLLDDVLPLAVGHVLKPVSGLDRVLHVALLVEEDRRDELETRLEVLAEEVHERMAVSLVGPTAPYDFAGGA
jgi:hypothetical protein